MGASGWAKTVFWPTAVAMAFLKSRFLLRFELARNGRGGMPEVEDEEAAAEASGWVERKGDGEGMAGGSMAPEAADAVGVGFCGVDEDARVGVEDDGSAGCADALSSLRAAFFLRRRTLRSCVAFRPEPGGTGG